MNTAAIAASVTGLYRASACDIKGAHEHGDACGDESPRRGPKILRSLKPHRGNFVPSSPKQKKDRPKAVSEFLN
jgi:hypothetical protein